MKNYKKRNTIGILKKSIGILISLIIILSSFPVFAAGQPMLSVGSSSDSKSGKIKIDISLDQPKDIAGLQFSIKYDTNRLTVENADIEKGTALNGWLFDTNNMKDTGEIKFACASSTGLKTTVPIVVCSISFTVKKGTTSGDAPITIDSIIAGNDTAQNIQLASKNGKITIQGVPTMDGKPDQEALDTVDTLTKISSGLKGSDEGTTVQNIDSAAQAIVDAVQDSISTSNKASAKILNEAVQDTIDSIITIAKDFKDEKKISTVNDSIVTIINAVGNALSADVDQNNLNLITGTIKDAVKSTVGLIDNVQNIETAKSMVQKIITSCAAVVNKAEKAGGLYNGIENEAVKIAEMVVAKAGTQSVTAKVKAGKAVAAVDDTGLKALLIKADSVSAVANTLQKQMSDSGLTKTIEKKVKVEINAAQNMSQVTAEVPGQLFAALQSKKLDAMEITSGMATLTVTPDFIKDADKAKTISLEVKKANAASAEMNLLSADQKKLVNAGAVIYDFNTVVTKSTGENVKTSIFEKEIEVSLPYAIKASENPGNITVLYLADDGKIKNMSGQYNAQTGTVTFRTSHFSKYVVKTMVVSFTDVSANYWAMPYIQALTAKGILSGKGTANTFKPNDPITRAEFAQILTTALGIVDEKASSTFTDVKSSGLSSKYIESAVKAGIVNGIGNGKFGPDLTITRQDMAVMLTRALNNVYKEKGVTNAQKTLSYSDKSKISSYAADAIATALKYSLMSGKPGNLFDPAGSITRAEVAAVIYRLYNH